MEIPKDLSPGEEIRAWALAQAVEYSKRRENYSMGAATRLAALYVRYVRNGEVER